MGQNPISTVHKGFSGDVQRCRCSTLGKVCHDGLADFHILWGERCQEDMQCVEQFGFFDSHINYGKHIRHIIEPRFLVTLIVRGGVIQGESVSSSAERTSHAVHVAVQSLGGGAHTAPVALLLFAEGVDVAVVVVELLLCSGDALIVGTQIDVVLVVISFHKKVLRFSISRNGGLWVLPKNGCKKPTAVLTEFSVSVCSKPAQKAATLFTCAAGYR